MAKKKPIVRAALLQGGKDFTFENVMKFADAITGKPATDEERAELRLLWEEKMGPKTEAGKRKRKK